MMMMVIMIFSACQSAGDTVTALADSNHAGSPSDRRQSLPVHPPEDDGLDAALADLAAAHSHAQAAADGHSDIAHSA